MSENLRPPAVVIGGGAAGIAATMVLRAAGVEAYLLEAEAVPGGRLSAEWDPLGAELANTDRALVQLLGGEPAWYAPEVLQLRCGAEVALGPASDAWPGPWTLGPGAWKLSRLERLLARYGPLLDPDHPERAAPLDDRSFAEFAALYFGRRALSDWLEPWLAGRGSAPPDRTSRVAFLLARSRRAGGAVRVPASPVRDLLAAACRGHTVWQARVERVTPAAAGGFEVSGTRGGDPLRLQTPAVVMAVPAENAAVLADACLVPHERRSLSEWPFVPSATWTVRAERVPHGWRRPLDHAGGILLRIPAVESPLLAALAARRYAGETWLAVRLRPAAALGAACRSADLDRLAVFVRAELARCLPSLRLRLQLGAGRWVVERNAFPGFAVGAYRNIARLRRIADAERRRGRRLYLAGDYWIEGTLDGAARSGQRAARELLADAARSSGSPP